MKRPLSVLQQGGNQAGICVSLRRSIQGLQLATVQDYQVEAIHHDLIGGQCQTELNKWKRYNIACVCFPADRAIGEKLTFHITTYN